MENNVADFYDGQSILITGASGFLGKVLVEKLLYSCPKINKVYILLRSKKNFSVQQRMQTLLENQIFTRLKKEHPSAMEKIVPISGDVKIKNLGLNSDDEKLLLDKVSIVFHLAATTNFIRPIEEVFNINVGGIERILNLCKRMSNIQKFVYISTAFSNSERSEIDEQIYPAPVSLDEMKRLLINGITDDRISKVLNGKPNSYILTKAIAEEYIKLNHDHVPSIIIRPAIVSSSKTEPLEGWIDNWSGASGLLISIIKGYIPIMLTRNSHVLDLIPVDYVTNLTIVATAKCNHIIEDVPVFNSSTSEINPLTMEMLRHIVEKYNSERDASDSELLCTDIIFTMSKSKTFFITLFKQILPAHIGDMVLHLKRKEKRYTKMLSKVLLVRKVLEPFTSNTWVIRTQNARALANSLSESDKAIFPFDSNTINWSEYLPIYINGMYKYLLKS